MTTRRPLDAYRRARTRASIARYFEALTLYEAIYDATYVHGQSIRDTARTLGVPKSTVARHARKHPNPEPPMHGTEDEYRDAYQAIYGHTPDHIPYTWDTQEAPDGTITRTITANPLGTTRLTTHEREDPYATVRSLDPDRRADFWRHWFAPAGEFTIRLGAPSQCFYLVVDPKAPDAETTTQALMRRAALWVERMPADPDVLLSVSIDVGDVRVEYRTHARVPGSEERAPYWFLAPDLSASPAPITTDTDEAVRLACAAVREQAAALGESP